MMEVLIRVTFGIQVKPNLKKRFYKQVPSNFSKDNKDTVPNPKPQGGKGGGS